MDPAGMFAPVTRRKRSAVWLLEAPVKYSEEASDKTVSGSNCEASAACAVHGGEAVLSTPSVVGNGDAAPRETKSSTLSDRPRRVRARKAVMAAAEVEAGGNVVDDDVDSDTVKKEEFESERQRKEELEKELLRKVKMVVEDQSPTSTSGDEPDLPPGEKLMGDAIRGGRRRPNVTTKPKKPKHHGHCKFWVGLGNDAAWTSSAGSDMDASLDNIAVVDERLRATLKKLCVMPVRLYGKKMSRSDRMTGQNRLQMSRKSWHKDDSEPFPFDEILTQAEKKAAANDGLFVQAYDRTGKDYILKLKYLACNDCYRLMDQWGRFINDRELVLEDTTSKVKNAQKKVKKAKKKVNKVAIANEAMIDLWTFRSRELTRGKDGHEDGRLGLLILHYFKGEAPHADAAFEANKKLLAQAPKKMKNQMAQTGLPLSIERLWPPWLARLVSSWAVRRSRTTKWKQPWRFCIWNQTAMLVTSRR
ncbi:hypothetical protein E2562_031179 [Oryza meyeriana var. granulata]|uniref:Uncharacterized protein n=1 Tax=Oryza meyeriana var. granulata TaxID=110450 RepID=A0A6G1ERG7_9ORYZ|nr:hypothetical protein E2562_031179 [Oryza meyeriana var. granulata]